MKGAWFLVTCKVDNGCRIETWESLVYALTASQAKLMAKADWETRDNETTASILSARKISETEILTRQVGTIV